MTRKMILHKKIKLLNNEIFDIRSYGGISAIYFGYTRDPLDHFAGISRIDDDPEYRLFGTAGRSLHISGVDIL